MYVRYFTVKAAFRLNRKIRLLYGLDNKNSAWQRTATAWGLNVISSSLQLRSTRNQGRINH